MVWHLRLYLQESTNFLNTLINFKHFSCIITHIYQQRFSRYCRLKNYISKFWSVIPPNQNEVEQNGFHAFYLLCMLPWNYRKISCNTTYHTISYYCSGIKKSKKLLYKNTAVRTIMVQNIWQETKNEKMGIAISPLFRLFML